MIFNLVDHLREKIAEINDAVVDKFNDIVRAEEEAENIAKGPMTTNAGDLNFTPVNAETFGKWCSEFMAKLQKEEEANMTEADRRLTGREWFKENKALEIEDLTLEDETSIPKEPESDMAKFEEEKYDDDDEEKEEDNGALYDKNLFAEELGADLDEDVDFD